jgi:uncharacterized membrane protein
LKTKLLRTYLLAGLVVWLPIVVTIAVVRFIVDILDKTIALLPTAYQPEQLFGVNVPGFGVILSLISLILTGVIATNFLGQRLVSWGEILLAKIPFISPIYNASKQIIQAIFASNSQAFRKVVLVEYPRKDMWSLGFLTSESTTFTSTSIPETEMATVFVPTTPNPTSGFLLIVAKQDLRIIEMSVDEALKFIISLGVMKPPTQR